MTRSTRPVARHHRNYSTGCSIPQQVWPPTTTNKTTERFNLLSFTFLCRNDLHRNVKNNKFNLLRSHWSIKSPGRKLRPEVKYLHQFKFNSNSYLSTINYSSNPNKLGKKHQLTHWILDILSAAVSHGPSMLGTKRKFGGHILKLRFLI